MSHRLMPFLLALLFILPAGCSDPFDDVDVDIVVGSITQTDQEFQLTVTVRNQGSAAVRYIACPGSAPGFSIRMVNEDGEEFVLDDPCVVFGAPCGEQTLAPGEHLSGTIVFRGSAWDPETQDPNCIPLCLPFGRYFAVFRFAYSEDKGVPLRGVPEHQLRRSLPFGWPEGPVDVVPAGTWGGQGIQLTTEACGGSFTLNCGNGRLSQPLILDGDGRFEGTGVIRTGPLFVSYQPVFYEGTVAAESMTLTISLPNDDPQDPSIGPVALTFGEEGEIVPCQVR